MHLYPEVTPSISELWQMGKWRNEVPLEELTPMWADWENAPEHHFYVDECQSGTLYAQGHSTPCISGPSHKDTTPNRREVWYEHLYLGTRTAKYLEHDQWT